MNELETAAQLLKSVADEVSENAGLSPEVETTLRATALEIARWSPVLERAQELAAVERYWADNPEESEEALAHLLGNTKPESRRMVAIIRLVMAVASAQRGQ